MCSNRREIMLSYVSLWAYFKITFGKVTPAATKVNEKKIMTSSTAQVTCCFVGLGVFVTLVIHLPWEKSILSNFSMPRGVAILYCESHSQAGSTSQKTSTFHTERTLKLKFLCDRFSNCIYTFSSIELTKNWNTRRLNSSDTSVRFMKIYANDFKF